MKSPSLLVSPADALLIRQIVERAGRLDLIRPRVYPALNAMMDLTACHANGCPLDLAGLLAARDFDFKHDVAGIAEHIDRDTGRLRDCFWPRHTAPETAEAE